MAIKPDEVVTPVEAQTYRCPGCGEAVDSRRMEEVLQHHQHVVLQHRYPPAWFNVAPDASRSRPNSGDHPTNPAGAAIRTRDAAVESAEARLRRYGH